jgi:hypothetical protein
LYILSVTDPTGFASTSSMFLLSSTLFSSASASSPLVSIADTAAVIQTHLG